MIKPSKICMSYNGNCYSSLTIDIAISSAQNIFKNPKVLKANIFFQLAEFVFYIIKSERYQQSNLPPASCNS